MTTLWLASVPLVQAAFSGTVKRPMARRAVRAAAILNPMTLGTATPASVVGVDEVVVVGAVVVRGRGEDVADRVLLIGGGGAGAGREGAGRGEGAGAHGRDPNPEVHATIMVAGPERRGRGPGPLTSRC